MLFEQALLEYALEEKGYDFSSLVDENINLWDELLKKIDFAIEETYNKIGKTYISAELDYILGHIRHGHIEAVFDHKLSEDEIKEILENPESIKEIDNFQVIIDDNHLSTIYDNIDIYDLGEIIPDTIYIEEN